MAEDAPSSVDMLDIQFKIHDKFLLFNNQGEPRSNVNLLGVSCSRGLLFAGNPHAAELKVVIIKDLVDAKEKEKQPMGRLVPLPCAPNMLACSADGNLLAINYTQNASGFLNIYSVQAFTNAQVIKPLHTIRLSPVEHVHAVQLLWNPVLPNNLAVVLSNGGLAMYGLKEGGNYEFHSIDKSQQVKCGCWSPKGKQIVLGFPNGKLQQFKPDLTPAKTIVCPPNVHGVPFDTIALHWLSTYQFAVIFLQHGEDCTPSLYVVNAPKGGNPSYVNYYDICYSGNGPRNHQFNFTHIPQWNLLLVTSANSVEVGLLGTTESGDTPTWIQYTLLDEARIEMPLNVSSDETFPMGFVYDTSSTHQLVISENKLPTMPMVHVLSTDGTLICFDFLNLRAGAVSVCSPPPPIADTSGQFRALDSLISPSSAAGKTEFKPASDGNITASALSFAFQRNAVTSTPTIAKDKPVSLFGGFGGNAATSMPSSIAPTQAFGGLAPVTATAASTNPPLGFGFGNNAPAMATSTAPSAAPFASLGTTTSFGGAAPTPTFGGFGAVGKPTAFSGFGNVKPAEPKTNATATVAATPAAVQKPVQPVAVNALAKSSEATKPLYTVPPTFTAPSVQHTEYQQAKVTEGVDNVIQQILSVQINAFNEEIEQLKQQTKAILSNIGNPNEIKSYTKRLDDLQEINEQANDHDFELDLQNLRHTLNESYAMLAECRSKLELFKNPDMSRLIVTNNFNATSRRQLNRLQSYVAANETQLQLIQQQIDTQWEQYQDVVRRRSDSKMHLPCLEGIYQRMTKLQNVLSERRIKMNFIKHKLKQKGLLHDVEKTLQSDLDVSLNKSKTESVVDTLADSILSMTLSKTIDTNQSKLTADKLQAIRKTVQQQKIRTIKPQRPDRVDLKSEVILETKLKSERLTRERQAAAAAVAAAAAAAEQKAKATASSFQTVPATKPMLMTAPMTKLTESTPKSPEVNTQFGAVNAASTFPFGKGNTFIKPTAPPSAATGIFAPEAIKTADGQDKSNKPLFGGFGSSTGTSVATSLGFGISTGTSVATSLPFGSTTGTSVATALSFGKGTTSMATPITAPVLSFGTAPMPTKPIPTSGADNQFAGIGNNLTITKVITTQEPTTPKETKSFEFASTAINAKNVSKPEETIVKPFQATSFFGGSPAATVQSTAVSTSTGPALSFGGYGATLGLGTTATPTSFATTPAQNSKSSFSFNAPPTTPTSTPLGKSTSGKNLFGGLSNAISDLPDAATTTTSPSAVSFIGTTTTSNSSSSSTASGTDKNKSIATAASSPTEESNSFIFGGAGATTTNDTTSALAVSFISTTTTTTTTPASPPATDTVEKLLDSVTICQPTTKEAETGVNLTNAPAVAAAANAFAGFGVTAGGGNAFGFGNTTTSTAGELFKGGIFATSNATTAPTATTVGAAAATPTATATITSTTETPINATTANTAAVTAVTAATITASPTTNTFSFANALIDLSVAAATATTTTPPIAAATDTMTTPPAATSITPETTAVTAVATTPSIFGVLTPAASPFQAGATTAATGSVITTTPSIFSSTASAPAGSGSIFGTTTAASTAATSTSPTVPSGNIFGGIPKPDQSVFNTVASTATVPATGLFASAAAANPSPFNTPSTAGGGSIFGGSVAASNAAAPVNQNPFGGAGGGGGGSIFGGATSNASSPFGGNSIFGGGAASTVKPATETSTNIFGTPTSQTGAASAGNAGSIFGQNTFGQNNANAGGSGGNLFANSATNSPVQQQTSGFGTNAGGSIFGSASSNAANSGGSIFGNASNNTNAAPAFGNSAFGSFSSPSTGGAFSAGNGGAFASVAQTGFGSPQQQQQQQHQQPQTPQHQTNAFGKPVFGGTATFGNPSAAFGASPTFGGAATFGSPKGFGSFTGAAAPTNTASPPAFGAPAQKNNLFEALGSTDSGLSFGNLAQSANVQKPAFGGSSFMNYRA